MVIFFSITSGYSEGISITTAKDIMNSGSKELNPEDYVTNAELAQIIVKLLDYQARQIDNIVDQLKFTVKIETDKALGTGVIVGKDLVLTAAHVVGSNLKVTFNGDYKAYDAEVIKLDESLDLALLKTEIPSEGVKISDEDVKLLDAIYIIGTPLGISDVFSYGRVSKLDQGYLHQLDASINNGNSGGPVFNENGELVGIVKSKRNDANNVAYMVQLKQIKALIKQ